MIPSNQTLSFSSPTKMGTDSWIKREKKNAPPGIEPGSSDCRSDAQTIELRALRGCAVFFFLLSQNDYSQDVSTHSVINSWQSKCLANTVILRSTKSPSKVKSSDIVFKFFFFAGRKRILLVRYSEFHFWCSFFFLFENKIVRLSDSLQIFRRALFWSHLFPSLCIRSFAQKNNGFFEHPAVFAKLFRSVRVENCE